MGYYNDSGRGNAQNDHLMFHFVWLMFLCIIVAIRRCAINNAIRQREQQRVAALEALREGAPVAGSATSGVRIIAIGRQAPADEGADAVMGEVVMSEVPRPETPPRPNSNDSTVVDVVATSSEDPREENEDDPGEGASLLPTTRLGYRKVLVEDEEQ